MNKVSENKKEMNNLRVGFVGCGNIARVHLRAIQSAGADLVGIADQFIDYARRFGEECGGVPVYGSVHEMISQAKPDVVHVLTPPATHCRIVIECLEAGCHVLVEKPMAMNPDETARMMEVARRCGKILSVDHNYRFESVVLRANELLQQGRIGRLVRAEVNYEFDLNRYPALLKAGAEKSHWIYKLNGGPLEDHMAHPLSLVYKHLGEVKELTALSRNFGIVPKPWDDEIAVTIDASQVRAQVNVSFCAKPDAVSLTLRGTDGVVIADLYTTTVVMDRDGLMPRAAARGLMGFNRAWQHARGGLTNVFNALVGRMDKTGGVSAVVDGFYDAVREQKVPPVTMEEGHGIVDLIHRIWPQSVAPAEGEEGVVPIKQGAPATVLVTGAAGFVGSHLIQKLVEQGESVRALVRPSSHGLGLIQSLDCEVMFGDLANAEQVRNAMEGIEIVYHIGGAIGGGWEVHEASTVQGTRNILDAARQTRPKRIVYYSSLAVYDLLSYPDDTVITEEHPFVKDERGFRPYTWGKIQAERLMREAQAEGIPTSIIRPGIIIGARGPLFFPHLGFKLKDKLFIVLGKGDTRLPFVYIDNLVEGTISAARRDEAVGKTYNMVDDGEVTVLDYIQRYIKQAKRDSKWVRIPFFLPYVAAGVYELVSGLGLLKKDATSRRQLKWKHKNMIYSSAAAKRDLDWATTIPVDEAIRETIDSNLGIR